jgi:pimeloyl-ACP methyl ester carboxylesterase
VLLLHGLGGRASVWDPLAQAFAEGTGTEGLTAPGQGAPDQGETRDVELWDVELPWRTLGDTGWSHTGDPGLMVVEAVDAVDDTEVVVAHSYAANLLLEEYASGRLAPRPTLLLSPFYRASPEAFDWKTISYYLNEFHQTFAEALRLGDTGRYPEKHRSWMAERLRDHIGPYGWTRFFTTYLGTPFLDLAAIRAPVLVLTGESDIAARPADGRALAAALPDGRYVELDSCGHFPMLERTARVARAVSELLGTARHQADTGAVS